MPETPQQRLPAAPGQKLGVRFWLWFLVAMLFAFYWSALSQQPVAQLVAYSEFKALVRAGQVTSVTFAGRQLTGAYADGARAKDQPTHFRTLLPDLDDPELLPLLDSHGVTVAAKSTEPVWWLRMLLAMLPWMLLLGLVFYASSKFQERLLKAGPGGGLFGFGQSRAKRFNVTSSIRISFDDVAGVDNAKRDLQEIVEFLRDPQRFRKLGAKIPRGVLLMGPPGTGKTMLAKALAGEAGVPFYSISGSEFVEMFVGVGAARVRDMFDSARKDAPSVIFIDEIDSVGRIRGSGLGGSHDEREQTLNQILVEMDGFDTDTNVIIIAATNRPDILDPALLRPGRFDRRVVLDRPDLRGREEIFNVHVRGKPLAADVELHEIARMTPGFVGADIENTINEAAILAARRNRKSIGMSEIREAIERVIAGPQRKSRILSPDEKETVAYHEAGHAVVAHMLPNCDPVTKVTVIPRGMGLGYTLAMPEDDRYLQHKVKFEDELAYALGGRAAEELIFGDVTTGSANDLERVTKLARDMVTRYGMSEKLGPMVYGQKDELVFLGREIGEQRDYSDSVAQEIDSEVRRIVNGAYQKALDVLTQHRDKLESVAGRLMEAETLDAAEFEALMSNGQPPTPPKLLAPPKPVTRLAEAPDLSGPSLELPPSPAPA